MPFEALRVTGSHDLDDLAVLKQVASGALRPFINDGDLATSPPALRTHVAFLVWLFHCLDPLVAADAADDDATSAVLKRIAAAGGNQVRCVSLASAAMETPVDLLHLPAQASAELARRTLETALPRLSRRGVVVVSGLRRPGNGAVALWDELIARHPSFEFRHGEGLGVLCIGEDPPPALRLLCEATEDAAAAQNLRSFFASLDGPETPGDELGTAMDDDRPLPRAMPLVPASGTGSGLSQTLDRMLQRHARSLWRKLHARDVHKAPLPGTRQGPAQTSTTPAGAARRTPSPPSPTALHVRRIDAPPRTVPGREKLLVCVSHVPPFPPRAGNEYRIDRMLDWLGQRGWDVLLVVCPLGGESLTDAQGAALAGRYENVAVLSRSGELSCAAARPAIAAALGALDGRPIRDAAARLNEGADRKTARLLPVTRNFCPDALVETLAALDEELRPDMVLANYVFMTRALPLLRRETLKVVDTHDVFSTKAGKVATFGVADSLQITPAEEAALLSRADLAIAIQPEEAQELRQIEPEVPVVTAGVDMPDIAGETAGIPPSEPVVLIVASDNAMNAKGLRDFLRFAWPHVRAAVPGAELHVIGSVGAILSGDEPGVRALGRVDDLAGAYRAARLAVNPAVAGTGLKIKTLEALAHLRPIVLWPTGVEGMAPELRGLCDRVTDWFAFAEAVVRLLTDDAAAGRVAAARERIAALLSPETVYASLEQALAEGLSRSRRAVPA